MCLNGGHHVRVMHNTISSTGVGGVTAKNCDYTTVHGNTFHRVGYGGGWGSAVSINESRWVDGYSGFHTFVTGNVISGTHDASGRNTDGNGIIMDRAASGTSTPRMLVANNVVAGSYGRCIHGYRSSNLWVVNNTCYRNVQAGWYEGEFNLYAHSGGHMINNVAYAARNGRPFKDIRGAAAVYQRNVAWGGSGNEVPGSGSGSTRIRTVNPLFESAFSLTSWGSSPSPGSIGTRLAPSSGSPLRSAGIDPRSASGVNSNMRAGMEHYVRMDVQGRSRPQGGWDIGAYER
jgi:hypothetical protein